MNKKTWGMMQEKMHPLNMKSVTIFNRKGGVGKTSITAALAMFYGGIGKKVLCLDLDSQMNLSLFLSGLDKKAQVKEIFEHSIQDVIYDDTCKINEAIYPAGLYVYNEESDQYLLEKQHENIFFIPGSDLVDKKNIEILSKAEEFPQFILREKLGELEDTYDIILQDNSPGENLLSIMSLVSCENGCVLEPVTPDINAIVGLELCKNIIRKVKRMNPGLKDLGCILNDFKSRESISQYTLDMLSTSDECDFTGITIRSASKIPVSMMLKEGIVNTDRYMKNLPQSQKIAEDIIKLGEYILERI